MCIAHQPDGSWRILMMDQDSRTKKGTDLVWGILISPDRLRALFHSPPWLFAADIDRMPWKLDAENFQGEQLPSHCWGERRIVLCQFVEQKTWGWPTVKYSITPPGRSAK